MVAGSSSAKRRQCFIFGNRMEHGNFDHFCWELTLLTNSGKFVLLVLAARRTWEHEPCGPSNATRKGDEELRPSTVVMRSSSQKPKARQSKHGVSVRCDMGPGDVQLMGVPQATPKMSAFATKHS